MMKFFLVVLLFSSNSLFAESRRVEPITIFLSKETYLTDFKNNFEKIKEICIGKVIVEENAFEYFVCNKYFGKVKTNSSVWLDYAFKELGLKRPKQPEGSFIIQKPQSYSENKLQNGKNYFVFMEGMRTFFIEIEKAKEYIDFLANKNFPDVLPNPAHQVCFKKSDCILVNKSCTKQVGINKKYLNKYSVASTEKNLEKCNNEKKEINQLSCVENICTINNK